MLANPSALKSNMQPSDLTTLRKELSDIVETICNLEYVCEDIRNDPTLSPAEKREQLDDLTAELHDYRDMRKKRLDEINKLTETSKPTDSKNHLTENTPYTN